MADISELTYLVHFVEWKFFYSDSISVKFVPEGSIDNNSGFILV